MSLQINSAKHMNGRKLYGFTLKIKIPIKNFNEDTGYKGPTFIIQKA